MSAIIRTVAARNQRLEDDLLKVQPRLQAARSRAWSDASPQRSRCSVGTGLQCRHVQCCNYFRLSPIASLGVLKFSPSFLRDQISISGTRNTTTIPRYHDAMVPWCRDSVSIAGEETPCSHCIVSSPASDSRFSSPQLRTGHLTVRSHVHKGRQKGRNAERDG